MKAQLFLTLMFLTLLGCSLKPRKQLEDPQKAIVEMEKASAEKSNAHLGKSLGVISFEVKTNDTENFKNGLIPWVSLQKPNEAIRGLMDDELSHNYHKPLVYAAILGWEGYLTVLNHNNKIRLGNIFSLIKPLNIG